MSIIHALPRLRGSVTRRINQDGWITVVEDGYLRDGGDRFPRYRWAVFGPKGEVIGISDRDGCVVGGAGQPHNVARGLNDLASFLSSGGDPTDPWHPDLQAWVDVNRDALDNLTWES